MVMDERRREAVRVVAEYVSSLEKDESIDVEVLVARRPDLESELLALQASLSKVREITGDGQGRSLHAALEARVDAPLPEIELEAESEADSSGSEELFRQLAGRTGAFGRYRLKGELARGGQGVIVRAWDEDLRRHLAMKVVLGQTSPPSPPAGAPSPVVDGRTDERTLVRFLEEAQVTGQLDHPGIVPVHEIGLDDRGYVYFTMRLVRGDDLSEVFKRVRRGQDGWTRTGALNVLLKACEAMSYAHSKGVIHRDLKPSNIMVGRFGEVYVMDWGLARVRGRKDTRDLRLRPGEHVTLESLRTLRREEAERTPDSSLVTMDGDVIGTPSYMPPEQAMGDLDRVGLRSDVYAAGTIMYELLAGRAPYTLAGTRRSPLQILLAVQDGSPRPLDSFPEKVPPELTAICEKAMARDPGDRYATMLEFASDLRAYLEGRVVSAHQTGAVIELRKWFARNRALAASLAAALLLAIAGLGTVGVVQAQGRREVESELYAANIAAAMLHVESENAPAASARLEQCPERLRGWEWRFLSAQADASAATLPIEDRAWKRCIYSADGENLLVSTYSRLVIADAKSLEILEDRAAPSLTLGVERTGARTCQFVLDEERYRLVVREESLQAEETTLIEFPQNGQSTFVGSPTAVFSRDGRLLLTDPIQVTGSEVEPVYQPITLWDIDLGLPVAQFPHATSATMSEDGALLVVAERPRRISIWSTAPLRKVQQLDAPSSLAPPLAGKFSALAISEDGSLIAAGGEHYLVCWRRDRPEPLFQVLANRSGHHGLVYWIQGLAFHPDGRSILSTSGRVVRQWDGQTGDLLRSLLGHDDLITSLAVADDGRTFATTGRDGTARVWGPDSAARVDAIATKTLSILSDDVVALELDGNVWIHDAHTAIPLDVMELHSHVWSIDFDEASGRLATAAQAIEVWDLETGQRLQVFSQSSSPADSLRFRPGRNQLLWSGFRGARLWNLSTNQLIAEWTDGQGVGASYSQDGELLVLGGGRQVSLWAGDLLGQLWTREVEQQVADVAFHPNRQLVAVGLGSGEVLLLDASDGRERLRINAQSVSAGTKFTVAWIDGGRRLCTAGGDETLSLWDPTTGRELMSASLDGNLVKLAVGPGGQWFATATESGHVRIWDSRQPGELLEAQLDRAAHIAAAATTVTELVKESWNRPRTLKALEATIPDHPQRALATGLFDVQAWEARRLVRTVFDEAFAAHLDLDRALDAAEADPRLGDALSDLLSEIPASPRLLHNMARKIVESDDPRRGDPAHAIELARKAADLEPRAAHVDTLAWALAADGQNEAALKQAQRAIDMATLPAKWIYEQSLERLAALAAQDADSVTDPQEADG
jgi:serine/threonine protein kinase/WD40 repeat protein